MARTRRSETAEEPASKRAKTEEGSSSDSIQVGDPLPDVTVTLQSGETVDLGKKYSSGILVLFAYPKASTPGCTRQTSGFSELYSEFQKLGAAVYGLSADTPKAQTTFKEKTGADFDLISDPQYELLGPLGAKKAPRGVIRSHWVFSDGKAVLVEHNVKPDASPSTALEKVKELTSSNETKDEEDDEKVNGQKQEANGANGEGENEEEDEEDEDEPAIEDPKDPAEEDDDEEDDGEYGEEEAGVDAEEDDEEEEEAEEEEEEEEVQDDAEEDEVEAEAQNAEADVEAETATGEEETPAPEEADEK